MSNDPAVQPDVTTSIPASEAAPTTVASTTESNTTEDDSKPRIKIGSQRDGAAPTKVPPRVITEFKTTAPATKQVFVQLDQQGNFQPLATPATPAAATTAPAPAPTQRPPQQQQGQRNRGPRRDQPREGAEGEQPTNYKAKPQSLTPNVNQPAKGNSLFSEQRSGPRVEVPSTRGQLSMISKRN